MIMNCPHCGNAIECDFDLVCGQHVLCPYCEMKFVYDNDHSASENASARGTVVTRRKIGGRTAIALFAAAIVMVVVAPCVIMCMRWIGSPADKRVTIDANQSDEVLAAKAYAAFMDGDSKKASRYAEAIRDEAARILLVSTFKNLDRMMDGSGKRTGAASALTDEEESEAGIADMRMTIDANQPDEVLAAKAYEAFMEGDSKKASRYAEAIRDEASRIILVSTFKDLERTTREESRKRAIAVDVLTDEEGDKARAAADSIREDTIMSIGE